MLSCRIGDGSVVFVFPTLPKRTELWSPVTCLWGSSRAGPGSTRWFQVPLVLGCASRCGRTVGHLRNVFRTKRCEPVVATRGFPFWVRVLRWFCVFYNYICLHESVRGAGVLRMYVSLPPPSVSTFWGVFVESCCFYMYSSLLFSSRAPSLSQLPLPKYLLVIFCTYRVHKQCCIWKQSVKYLLSSISQRDPENSIHTVYCVWKSKQPQRHCGTFGALYEYSIDKTVPFWADAMEMIR